MRSSSRPSPIWLRRQLTRTRLDPKASSSTLVDTPSPPRPLSPSLSPSPSPSPSAAPPPPTLHLLSRAAGRPRLARLATHLAASSQKDLTAESVTHAIDCASSLPSSTCLQDPLADRSTPALPPSPRRARSALPLSEPDLLLVLGGSYLRLRGFPPWQLRLTELQCVSLSSPFLSSPLLSPRSPFSWPQPLTHPPPPAPAAPSSSHAPHPTWLAAQRVRYAHVRAALDTYGRAEMRLGR